MKLDNFDIMPHTKPVEFARVFEVAGELWPDRELTLVGHDGEDVHMQEYGNPTPFKFPLSRIRS